LIDIPTAEKYLDKVDEWSACDRTAAIALIGLRKYRASTVLNRHPKEIMLLIAKMLYTKSRQNAWEKLRSQIKEESAEGAKKYMSYGYH
jgi:hypothetical protein